MYLRKGKRKQFDRRKSLKLSNVSTSWIRGGKEKTGGKRIFFLSGHKLELAKDWKNGLTKIWNIHCNCVVQWLFTAGVVIPEHSDTEPAEVHGGNKQEGFTPGWTCEHCCWVIERQFNSVCINHQFICFCKDYDQGGYEGGGGGKMNTFRGRGVLIKPRTHAPSQQQRMSGWWRAEQNKLITWYGATHVWWCIAAL